MSEVRAELRSAPISSSACVRQARSVRGWWLTADQSPAAASLVFRDGENQVGEAALSWARGRTPLLRRLRIADVDCLRLSEAAAGAVADVHRALLDSLFDSPLQPAAMRVVVPAGREADVDILWRLALGAGLHCVIRETASEVDVVLSRRTVSGALGALAFSDLGGRLSAALRWRLRRPRGKGGHELHGPFVYYVRDAALPPTRTPPEQVEFTEVDADHVRRWPYRYGMPLSGAPGVAPSSRGYVATVNGQAAFHMWAVYDEQIIRHGIPAAVLAGSPAPHVLLLGASTESRFQGRGIYTAALEFASARAHERGAATVIGLCRDDNVASMTGLAKAAFRRVAPG